jgi:serine/threonine protein kinase/tetratricopeptide (TPR) repeat protein
MQAAFASKRFEIVRTLGEGGMGIVYEALDRERGGRVALKTLRNASAEHLARLKREFRAMQDVQHTNLVALRELVCEDQRWFLTMDLVDGVDFIQFVQATPLVEPMAPSSEDTSMSGSAPTIRMAAPHEDAPVFDDARLRAALRQVTEGLLALHAVGMVHCDIKPSNVLVRRDGRVVVLDFGLVAETRTDATTIEGAGTPTYMAPEQASGHVGPEADWYAVGVLLYQALTGRVPFNGPALQVMMRKQSEMPIPPSAIGVGVPPDLDALCTALLRFKPGERPNGGAVLRHLGGAPRPSEASASRTLTPTFVGRAKELGELADALRESRSEGFAIVVEGESGVGKSRLVRRFTEQILIEDPRTVVLAGRCYERESGPYKAFDGVMDMLARLLARMPEVDARAFLPTRPAPLAQVFPVLQRVPAIADAVRRPAPALDPLEVRSRAFGALRETLTRIGDSRTFVVVIDDAQWADDDSLALLAELTRAPDRPRLLLIATVRNATMGNESALLLNDEHTAMRLDRALGAAVRHIALGPLSRQEARELASNLIERAGAGSVQTMDADAIAAEARGHPLFIDVLARQTVQADGSVAFQARLEDALGAELSALDGDAREVVETVALAAAPLAQRVVQRAAPISPDHFAGAVQRLRIAHLVVTSGARGDDPIEPYHDRVRAAVFATLTDARRIEVHRAIARALERETGADPAALAFHWREAGDLVSAARFSVSAGDRAVQALAFDRAAVLYESALASRDAGDPDRRALLVKLGGALESAGRGKRAADVFHLAAEGASATRALDLRRRAAEQLLRSGHFDEGVEALERVLASVGVHLPKTPLGAMVSLLLFRIVLLVRGLRYRERDTTEVSEQALVRLDTCWSASFGLVMSDHVRGAALHARTLLAALRLGESYRVATALGAEVAYSAARGGPWARVESVVIRATMAAERSGQPRAIAWTLGATGAANYLHGRWRTTVDLCDRACDQLATASGVAWELDSVRFFGINALAQLGELRTLAQRSSSCLREAGDRGDLYATVNLRIGFGNLRWLVADDSEEARKQIDDAMAQWSKQDFHLEHYYELLARTNLDLYAGGPREAHRRVVRRWRALSRSLLPWRIQLTRINCWHLRARASLAVAAVGDDREAMLRATLADAARIEREEMPWATPLAQMLRAGVAQVRGDAARAASLLRKSIAGFRATDMALHASVARRALGALIGGDEGKTLVTEANAWFAEQTVKRPDGFMAMLAPGLTGLFEPARSGDASQRVSAHDARHENIESIPSEARVLLAHQSPRAGGPSERGEGEGALSSGRVPQSSTRMEGAIVAQLDGMDEDARTLTHTLALADAPLKRGVLQRATGVAPDVFTRVVQRLRTARLVVATVAHGDDRVEPYHDRVRAAVFVTLSAARRAEIHRTIARALEAEPDVDPEALALHWRGAGDVEQAAHFGVLAGDRAVGALAFDRAASLYEQALALRDLPIAESRQLYVKLGDALASAGRGVRSARAYERAMTGTMAADALDLRQRAAVQLLRGGHWDEGVALARSALESVGVWLPRTPLQAVLSLLLYRFLLRIRSLRSRERDASQVARSELTRIDTCRLIALCMASAEVVRGSALQSRELLLALRCGEPVRLACALAQESVGLAVEGVTTWKRSGALLARASLLAARTGDRYAFAMIAGAHGLRSFFAGRFQEGHVGCDDALSRFRECPGAQWEGDLWTRFSLDSLFYRGGARDLSRRFPLALSEAKSRGNLVTWTTLSMGAAGLTPLFGDDSALVRAQADEAMAAWSMRDFDVVHYCEVFALTSVDLYEGGAGNARAYARLTERWPALRRSFLLRVQFIRLTMWHCRARAALAAAAAGGDREALLAAALEDARRMEREGMAWSTSLATLVRAGVARQRGREAEAASSLRAAMTGLDGAEMALHAAVARRALGSMIGGDEGRTLLTTADTWFREQEIARPEGLVAMLAPGFGEAR